jgi:hypothetical protein
MGNAGRQGNRSVTLRAGPRPPKRRHSAPMPLVLLSLPMQPRRVAVSATLLASLCGVVLGLAVFAASAALWRSGLHQVAGVAAETVLLTALTCVAAIALLAQPTRMRKARVPISRAVPHAWWPPTEDPLPTLAACMGGPIAAGAGAAALLFH